MDRYIGTISPEVLEKAKQIRLLVTDVDGVLTDGGIIYDDNGLEYKKFNVKDGFIVSHLRKNGIMVGAITGRNSKVVESRCDELSLDFHYHGIRNKVVKLEEVLEILDVQLEETCYIGDDLLDLPLLQKAGLSACPADAVSYLRDKVDYVCQKGGGSGAFREIADILLHAQGILETIVAQYSIDKK